MEEVAAVATLVDSVVEEEDAVVVVVEVEGVVDTVDRTANLHLTRRLPVAAIIHM